MLTLVLLINQALEVKSGTSQICHIFRILEHCLRGAGMSRNGHLGQRNEKGRVPVHANGSGCPCPTSMGPSYPIFFFFLQFNSGSKQLVWPKAYLFFVYRCFMNHKRCENLKFIDRIFERSLHLLFFRDRDLVHCLRICQFWGKITHKMRPKFHN